MKSFNMNKIIEKILPCVGFGKILYITNNKNIYENKTYFINNILITQISIDEIDVALQGDAFKTIILDECLDNLNDERMLFLFKTIFLITKKNIYINVLSHSLNKEHLENLLFQIGFRKHPLYYKINPYDSLNKDTHAHILMEKIFNLDVQIDNSKTLENESLLHADMLRKYGRRSDGHCIRYFKASEFVRVGDSVLDLACGLGYGSHILYHSSLAKNIKGIDLCDDSITYANMYYSNENVSFEVGNAQIISQIADNSIDFITSFETIEHLPEPDKYLKELYRVLKPSGRLMISAPNDWTDETGQDPNPYHLHVYTLEKLKKECSQYFMIEKIYGQTAGGAMKCHHEPRSWREISPDIKQIDDEWIVLVCMKTPINNETVPYVENSWSLPNDAAFHVSSFARDYNNPWLVKAMVSIGMRNQIPLQLREMQNSVLKNYSKESVDYGSALCGYIYSLDVAKITTNEYESIILEIQNYNQIQMPSPHQLRWQVSLLYSGGELSQQYGDYEQAKSFYLECIQKDVSLYSPLLGNKLMDAFYKLAIMSLQSEDVEKAKSYLIKSLELVEKLLSGDWLNIRGDILHPLEFGYAESAQLLDKGARAAYLLRIMEFPDKNNLFYQEAKGFYERIINQKDRENYSLNQFIDDLKNKNQILENEKILLAEEVRKQDTYAQSLAEEVRKQDAHIQILSEKISCLESELIHEKNMGLFQRLKINLLRK